jgi:hypothetical protein
MAESMESRRFERKPIFDVPLPMRPSRREGNAEESGGEIQAQAPAKMAFSLMTKKGNKQQVESIIPILVGLSLLTFSRHVPSNFPRIPNLLLP